MRPSGLQIREQVFRQPLKLVPQHPQQLFFAQHRHAQCLRLFQFAACGFAGHHEIGFFGHAAAHFAAGGFDEGGGLVAFQGGQGAG